jgi:hypothetical protein
MMNQIRHGRWFELYSTEGQYLVPQEFIGKQIDVTAKEAQPYIQGEFIQARVVDGYCVRLSSPGYLDCTEWFGPFETYEEAQDHLTTLFGDIE